MLGNFVSVPSASWESEHQIYVSVDNGENTGVAISNPDGDQAVLIDLELLDHEGNHRANASIELAAHEQRALFVTDPALFGSILSGINSFKGTLNITTRDGRLVSVTALIQKKADGRLLALPSGKRSVAELLSSQAASESRRSESGS